MTPAAVTIIQDNDEEHDFRLEDAVLRSTQGYNDSPWPPGFSINIYVLGGEPTGRHVLFLVPLSNKLSDWSMMCISMHWADGENYKFNLDSYSHALLNPQASDFKSHGVCLLSLKSFIVIVVHGTCQDSIIYLHIQYIPHLHCVNPRSWNTDQRKCKSHHETLMWSQRM